MLATLIAKPFDDDAWAFEPKWDGVRALVVMERDVRIITRNHKDVTVAYPELQEIKRCFRGSSAVLDGEIVTFDNGVPSFQKLQGRMHVRDPAAIERLRRTTPVAYIAFDVIYADGRDLTSRSYDDRRDRLERRSAVSTTLQLSPKVIADGTDLFEAAKEQRLEGIVGKRRSSRYEPGRRSRNWVKVKTTFDADVLIAGWTAGEGRRAGRLGALLMAVYDDGALRYVGSVGTGFTEQTLDTLERRLRPLATDRPTFPPGTIKGKPELRRANWVRPTLVAIVEFRQLTSGGRLRAPSFKGLRDDKHPEECTYEELRRAAGI